VAEQEDEFEGMQEELAGPTAPERVSSTETAGDRAAPRSARFGEGPEGRPARKERGAVGPRAGFFDRIGTFWRDVRAELRRVTWPTLKEVQNTTIITIIAVIFFAAYLWAVDMGLAKMIEGLTKLLGGS
jgi:preprotein translocase subunit SecE